MLANVKLNLVTALYVLSYVSVVNAYQQENEITPADNIDKRAGAIGNFFRDFTNSIFGNDNLEVNQPSTNGATSTGHFFGPSIPSTSTHQQTPGETSNNVNTKSSSRNSITFHISHFYCCCCCCNFFKSCC